MALIGVVFAIILAGVLAKRVLSEGRLILTNSSGHNVDHVTILASGKPILDAGTIENGKTKKIRFNLDTVDTRHGLEISFLNQNGQTVRGSWGPYQDDGSSSREWVISPGDQILYTQKQIDAWRQKTGNTNER